jgi:hypothetical protein
MIKADYGDWLTKQGLHHLRMEFERYRDRQDQSMPASVSSANELGSAASSTEERKQLWQRQLDELRTKILELAFRKADRTLQQFADQDLAKPLDDADSPKDLQLKLAAGETVPIQLNVPAEFRRKVPRLCRKTRHGIEQVIGDRMRVLLGPPRLI